MTVVGAQKIGSKFHKIDIQCLQPPLNKIGIFLELLLDLCALFQDPKLPEAYIIFR